MERLTFDGNFCDIAQCSNTPGGSFCESGTCSQRKVWERLEAYEDTGLTPKEVRRMSNILLDVGIDYNCSWEYVKNWLLDARLRELSEADKDGRVVVPLCKVGDTLWLTASYYTERLPQPMEARVVRIKIDAGDEITYATTRRRVSGKEIGKTVFLTREEAEKALEERRNEK